MAKNGKQGGGDRILESRHLVGLFLGVVLLCGVFFTLGYVMGRTQYGGSVHASESPARTSPAPVVRAKGKQPDASVSPTSGEWDFYSKKDNNHLEPASKLSASPSATPEEKASSGSTGAGQPAEPAVTPSAFLQQPKMLKGSLVLQIAALTHESDALAMADALQQRGFPSFVVAPSTDSFYRVQVGPYPDDRAAESAKSALDRAGFKAIIKR